MRMRYALSRPRRIVYARRSLSHARTQDMSVSM